MMQSDLSQWVVTTEQDGRPKQIEVNPLGGFEFQTRTCPVCAADPMPYSEFLNRYVCDRCQSQVYGRLRPAWHEDRNLPQGGHYSVVLANGWNPSKRWEPPFTWPLDDDEVARREACIFVARVLRLVDLNQLSLMFGGRHSPQIQPVVCKVNLVVRRGIARTWTLSAHAVPGTNETKAGFLLEVRRGKPRVRRGAEETFAQGLHHFSVHVGGLSPEVILEPEAGGGLSRLISGQCAPLAIVGDRLCQTTEGEHKVS